MGHDLIEDTRSALLDSAQDAEQHPTGAAAPGTVTHPGLAFEGFGTFDLALAEGVGRQAVPLSATPPTQPREGKAPEDGFIFVK